MPNQLVRLYPGDGTQQNMQTYYMCMYPHNHDNVMHKHSHLPVVSSLSLPLSYITN